MMNTSTVNNGLLTTTTSNRKWSGNPALIAYDEAGIKARIYDLSQPIYIINNGGQIGVTSNGHEDSSGSLPLVATVAAIDPADLGDASFRQAYKVRYAYASGAMANSIASVELVQAMGKAGLMSSYGAAGVVGPRLEDAIQRVQAGLPNGPYAFNLIHSPSEEAMERRAVELFLQYGVTNVEASAFLDLTPHVVRYRAAGLSLNPDGSIGIKNRIIAKVSRREVAAKFMEPAPERLLKPLVEAGWITPQQMELARHVPLADDVTVEADSGGHTDNRPLVSVLPAILSLRDELQAKHNFAVPVRVGAAGGIGTPSSALAAFMMGASYVVTGSINQSCIEAGASPHTKKLLSEADIADVMMAPAADMFEMGVKVQLLKRGTMFPMRAQRLYELYRQYNSIDDIPTEEREKLEKQVLKRPMEDIWQDTVKYFMERDPEQIHRASDNPKRKMALIFRWYLGLSSRWSNSGEKGREADYQIWCGPSMGAFNNWVAGTYLQQPENRRVTEIADHIMRGAAYLYRMQSLRLQGLQFTPQYGNYVPQPLN
ncbi:MAG TPA: PfaD family polyunsaturated fatty acid/polyketide biosynthesis protein [Phototrophicaceae bacterium]|jgi:PfaD family protein|nr:PfaD family polyunsaturated fatty acid/polyketide biosynthesis protein [Phototrophicaceae bacterium]